MMYVGRLFGLLLPVGALLLHPPYARACPDQAAPAWHPQRSWPAACEPNVPLDGFVLLEGDALDAGDPSGQGELEIVLQRTEAGRVLETLAGTVLQPDATSALFRAERPLAPNAEYLVSARRKGADARPSFTTAFTTGSGSLRPLAFRHAPSARLEVSERERFACTIDSCGEEQCTPTGDSERAHLVRVAVPPIGGGVEQKPYAVSAELVVSSPPGQAPFLATSDAADTQVGRRSFVVIELPHDAAGAREGCVTITATDVAGHSATTEPVCLALSASPAAGESDSASTVEVARGSGEETSVGGPSIVAGEAGEEADPDEFAYAETIDSVSSTPSQDADSSEAANDAGGCAIRAAGGSAGANLLGGLTLALTLTLARRRRR